MRRMIISSLVLLPVLAQAQSGISVSAPASATLQAKVHAPASLRASSSTVSVASVATPSVVTPVTASNLSVSKPVREIVKESASYEFLEASLDEGGTLEYTFRSTATQATQPKVTKVVQVGLSAEEMAAQPAVSDVAVRMTVDKYGFPRNLTVVKSAGAAVDAEALKAMNQYRFKPATVDNVAVEAAVTIEVKIEKQ